MRRNWHIKTLAVCLLVSSLLLGFFKPLASANALDDTENKVISVDEGIYNLDYNPDEILAMPGDKVESFVPKEGYFDAGKFIVVEREKKSITSSPVDVSVINSSVDRTYPGALLLADQNFMFNRPTALVAPRKPIALSIDLPGMTSGNTAVVENPNNGNVKAAINGMVDDWINNYSDRYTVPSLIQYTASMVHSETQIEAALSIGGPVLEKYLGLDFDSIVKKEKTTMVVAYKQIFYTVSSELPARPSDLFDDSVTFEELERKGVSNQSPPMIVNNVAYGRTVYLKLETNSLDTEVEAAFNAMIKGVDISANSKFKNIIDNTTFTAVFLGGNNTENMKVVTKDFKEVMNQIEKNCEFRPDNPAYPLSYTNTFIKDNRIAAVHNNTEYIETNVHVYNQGNITLKQLGGYVAKFHVEWDEVSYDAQGKEIVERKYWTGNDTVRTLGYRTTFPLPANARNISIFVNEYTGIIWEGWRTIVNQRNLPLSNNIVVTIWGSTLNPGSSVTVSSESDL